jgi:transposase
VWAFGRPRLDHGRFQPLARSVETADPGSADLRRRVVATVEDGVSCRAAAARFGIAPSTPIKWLRRRRRTGSIQPQAPFPCRVGDDRRSHRLEAHAAGILALIDESPDITLAEIVAHLEQQRRLRVTLSTVWRLLDRHGLSFKKKRLTLPSGSGLTSGSLGWTGSRRKPSRSRNASSSSTRRAPRPRWPDATAGHAEANAAAHRCHTGIGRRPPSSAPSAMTG